MIKRPLCMAAFLLMLGIFTAQWLGFSWIWRTPAGPLPEEWAAREEEVRGKGRVYRQEEKTFSNQICTYLYVEKTYLFIKSKKYPIRNIKCKLNDVEEELTGKTIVFSGKLTLVPLPGNPGEFNQRKYERREKIDFYLENTRLEKAGGEEGIIVKRVRQIREYLAETVNKIFPGREAGLLQAMMLGEKSQVEEEVKGWYQAAGISHVMAVSGLHMSLLGMSLWRILIRTGVCGWAAALSSGVLLAGYGILIGNPTTGFRALLMFGIMMGGKILGRTYDLLTALGLAGILLLTDNPDLLWDCGFQMSFMAVLGIGVYGKGQMKIVEKSWGEFHGKTGPLWKSLLMGWFLWIFSLPVVLYSFYQVSVAGIFCNLLVIPLLPLVLGSGGLALFLGLFHVKIGSLAGILAYGILKIYSLLGRWAEALSWGVWTPGQPSGGQIVVYYAALAGVWYGMTRSSRIYKKKYLVSLCYVCMSAGLLLIINPSGSLSGKITALDVGQGDGIVVQKQGKAFLVDGGSSSKKQVGKYVILPYLKQQGIEKLTGIFLTHTDEDHISGAREVLEEAGKGWLEVEYLFMPQWMRETEEGKELEKLGKQSGVKTEGLKKGDQVIMGKMKIKVLYPGNEDFSQDPNGGSLVLSWESGGVTGIFTGDLPSEQEGKILLDKEQYSFLKVGHHGSNGSSSETFLENISPEIALISCGLHNRYHHPGKEAVKRLEKAGAGIFRTDLQGAVTLYIKKDGKMEVERFREKYLAG